MQYITKNIGQLCKSRLLFVIGGVVCALLLSGCLQKTGTNNIGPTTPAATTTGASAN